MKIYPYITDAEGNIPITINLYSHDESEHMHDYIELVYIFSGSGIHYIDDRPYHLSRGCLLFIDLGQVHKYTVIDNMSYVNFKIRPEYLFESLNGKNSVNDIFSLNQFKNIPDTDSYQMARFEGHMCLRTEQLIFSVLEENLNKSPGYETIIKNSIINLLIQSKRNIVKEDKMPHNVCVIPDKLQNAVKFIDSHCGEKITLKSVSELCNYSSVYFSKLLKKHFGYGFSEYLMKRRINKAMNYLIETDIPINEISVMSGFSNKTHFYRIFQKHIGVKPSFIRTYENCVHSTINKSINAFYDYKGILSSDE